MSSTTDGVPEGKKKPGNSIAEMFRTPAALPYLFIAAAGLVFTATLLFLYYNSPLGAVLVLLVGVGGLLGGWSSAPAVVMFAVPYLVLYPNVFFNVRGVDLLPPRQSYFQLSHLLLISSTLAYLVANLRLYAITKGGMPYEAKKKFVKPNAKPTVRPKTAIADRELWRLFVRVGAAVLAGQLLWWAITSLCVDTARPFPIRFIPQDVRNLYELGPGVADEQSNRFLMAMLIVVPITLILTFALNILWLQRMNRQEAQAIVLDTAWRNARRDYNRPEAWRGWQKKKILGTLPRKGCGAWFLVVGVPVILFGSALLLLARFANG